MWKIRFGSGRGKCVGKADLNLLLGLLKLLLPCFGGRRLIYFQSKLIFMVCIVQLVGLNLGPIFGLTLHNYNIIFYKNISTTGFVCILLIKQFIG